MESPVFSVIVATHNNRDLLPRAIESVLAQTCPDFEILVVDDGSTDDTAFVVERIKDPRIRYVFNPIPSGSCDYPRNLGIGMAKGTFIAFLDEDDLWYPRRLEKVKRAFEEHPEVSAVCHAENRRVNGRITGINRYGPWTEDFHEVLLYERNCLSPGAMTIKADALREVNGFRVRKEFEGAADYDLWLRMSVKGMKIHFIDEPLGEFSLTGNNFSLVDPRFDAKVAFLLREHITGYENKPFHRLSDRGLIRLIRQDLIAAREYVRRRHYTDATRHLVRVLWGLLCRPAAAWRLVRWRGSRRPAGA